MKKLFLILLAFCFSEIALSEKIKVVNDSVFVERLGKPSIPLYSAAGDLEVKGSVSSDQYLHSLSGTATLSTGTNNLITFDPSNTVVNRLGYFCATA